MSVCMTCVWVQSMCANPYNRTDDFYKPEYLD